jgi:hypothetical protein
MIRVDAPAATANAATTTSTTTSTTIVAATNAANAAKYWGARVGNRSEKGLVWH